MDLPTYRQQQAQQFYDQLARGTHPLALDWKAHDAPLSSMGGDPRGVSGYPFQGDNAIQLMMAATERGFTSPYWMTFDQAKACGGTVQRGAVGTKILSWLAKDGGFTPILLTVFNSDQVSGVAWPKAPVLSQEAQVIRQAGLDALIPARKRMPKPEQYVACLRDVLMERFPDDPNEQVRAQAALRRDLAQMIGCARLGLPRDREPSMSEALAPYAVARPNWREVESAIDEATIVLKAVGILPLRFDAIARREIVPEVRPATEPARSRTRHAAIPASRDRTREPASDIAF